VFNRRGGNVLLAHATMDAILSAIVAAPQHTVKQKRMLISALLTKSKVTPAQAADSLYAEIVAISPNIISRWINQQSSTPVIHCSLPIPSLAAHIC